jgi:hypothetical protein
MVWGKVVGAFSGLFPLRSLLLVSLCRPHQPVTITSVLSELGFHWNNTRQAWQHPCGTIADERADYDPRKRYGSYFAADRIAA